MLAERPDLSSPIVGRQFNREKKKKKNTNLNDCKSLKAAVWWLSGAANAGRLSRRVRPVPDLKVKGPGATSIPPRISVGWSNWRDKKKKRIIKSSIFIIAFYSTVRLRILKRKKIINLVHSQSLFSDSDGFSTALHIMKLIRGHIGGFYLKRYDKSEFRTKTYRIAVFSLCASRCILAGSICDGFFFFFFPANRSSF